MVDENNIKGGGVSLIDPMEAIVPFDSNGTYNISPPYQNMFIFAELSAERRRRSVIINSAGKTTGSKTLTDIKISLMGYDQTDPENTEYTTRWSNNVGSTATQYEGFGIKNIDVIVDSSYVPRVTIEFVDIRGLVFFNFGKNSPYSVLFDFPPPMFNLTLKGYYGKSLTYQLHLVRTNTKFDSKTGNYYITVDFVARTFAPLTDVPFKYIDIMGLNNDTTKSEDPNIGGEDTLSKLDKPKNTHDLVKKLGLLYDDVNDRKDTSEESKAISNAETEIRIINNVKDTIKEFKKLLSNKYKNNATLLIRIEKQNIPDNGGNVQIIDNLSTYNNILIANKKDGIDENIESRLMLAIKQEDDDENNTEYVPPLKAFNMIDNELNNNVKKTLLEYSRQLSIEITENDITNAEKVDNYHILNEKKERYSAIDISLLYMKLENHRLNKITERQTQDIIRNQKINEVVSKHLGNMKPTLYNVFELLCDDVDSFFNQIRDTSFDAVDHHSEPINARHIIDNVEESNVGAFPLYIKEQIINNNKTQTREIPIDLSEKTATLGSGEFPEIKLINNFISNFIEIEKEDLVYNLRSQKDGNDNNVWFPISPLDSQIKNKKYESPYNRIENEYVGKSTEIIDKFLNKILERFYVTSQNTFITDFYREKTWYTTSNKDLIKMIANAEAANIANSLINTTLIDLLLNNVRTYSRDVELFYNYLEGGGVDIYTNVNPDILFLGREKDAYQLYNDPTIDYTYRGIEIMNSGVLLRSEDNDEDPIDKFIQSKTGFWNGVLEFFGFKIEKQFSKDNLIYFPDVDSESGYNTRYMKSFKTFSGGGVTDDTSALKSNSFIGNWDEYLNEKEQQMLDFLNDQNIGSEAKAFWIVYNFGLTKSLFSSENNLNEMLQIPALFQMPKFEIIYMGGLLKYNDDVNFKAQVDDIFTIDLNNPDDGLTHKQVNKLFLDKDVLDVKTLSNLDAGLFREEFNKFASNDFGNLKGKLVEMINKKIDYDNSDDDSLEYRNLLTESGYKTNITDFLNRKITLINHNQITFNKDYVRKDYISLKAMNAAGASEKIKLNNDLFFNTLFDELNNTLTARRKQLQNIKNTLSASIDDNNIKNQMYYSFKSISDKWVSIDGERNHNGFPLNDSDGRLIDRFVFVDRAMNPIGDKVMINLESLVDVVNDYDASVFTVISRLLSLNGFEFFPLQNMMTFSDDDWQKSFATQTTLDVNSRPAFVCMYIGGTSSYINNSNSAFDDDGLVSFDDTNIPDFTANGADSDLNEVKGNPEFPYSQTRAFKVKFGEQNQSVFKSIDLDSREYPETNESLQILSQIASDKSKAAPIPKGQNLFNLFETRSYECKVSMFGNMMIQPTQYFQLENIPMYSGVYLILSVQHNIVPNNMTTTFKGVRILKYPVPLVTDFLTSVGLKPNKYLINPYGNETPEENIKRLIDSKLYSEAERKGFVSRVNSESNINTWDGETNKNILTLHPLIQKRAEGFINEAEAGFYYDSENDKIVESNSNNNENIKKVFIKLRITSGFRSYQQQLVLFNMGSGTTLAKPGFSWHNYGLAFDAVEIINGSPRYYENNDGRGGVTPEGEIRWAEIGALGKKYGFTWGGDWTIKEEGIVDRPHFQDKFGEGISFYQEKISSGDSYQGYPFITQ